MTTISYLLTWIMSQPDHSQYMLLLLLLLHKLIAPITCCCCCFRCFDFCFLCTPPPLAAVAAVDVPLVRAGVPLPWQCAAGGPITLL